MFCADNRIFSPDFVLLFVDLDAKVVHILTGFPAHQIVVFADTSREDNQVYTVQYCGDMIAGILPDYRGYLGIDMMIYSDSAGKYRVQPCLEINLRYNMGIVALMLSRRYLDEHAEGEFTVRYYAKAGEAWQEHRHLQQLYPAVYKNNRIKSGYLNLTPVNEATHFVASLICY